MGARDPLDASTLDAPRQTTAVTQVPTLRVVFRPGAGIVREAARPLLAGRTVAGRRVGGPAIALDDDGLASREHAAFDCDPSRGRLSVEDLDSRNGVHVNGEPVQRCELVDGDLVRLGATFLVVRFEPPRLIDVPSDLLVGPSPAMQQVRVAVKRLAKNDASVLVLGETGTGKEVVAQALHAASGRSGPFIAVNCAAIPESLAESQLFGHVPGAFTGALHEHRGFFRAADRGTIFLDEIGDMPRSLQPKLLRALESRAVVPVGSVEPRPFDARVVAATNVSLESAVESGSFRRDLFARLAQLRVELTPLRDRREDILALVAHRLPARAPPLAPELVEALLLHRWPSNVRELFSVVTELSVWSDDAERLALSVVAERLGRPSDEPAPRPEPGVPGADELDSLLRKHAGNVAAVARETGRSRTQVYRWIAQLGLDATRYREP
jgi:DNA-binding NtrC family response regulator